MTGPRWFAWGWLAGAASVALLYSCLAHAGTATLMWNASTHYTNGAAITAPVTYNVYKGKRGQVNKPLLVSGLHVLTYTVGSLAGGQRVCFNVKAVVKGVKSAYSNEGCKWVAK